MQLPLFPRHFNLWPCFEVFEHGGILKSSILIGLFIITFITHPFRTFMETPILAKQGFVLKIGYPLVNIQKAM